MDFGYGYRNGCHTNLVGMIFWVFAVGQLVLLVRRGALKNENSSLSLSWPSKPHTYHYSSGFMSQLIESLRQKYTFFFYWLREREKYTVNA